MTLQCVIFLFLLREGGYIPKGIFCPVFIKVKEISKEQQSLKVVIFTVIFKPRARSQTKYVYKRRWVGGQDNQLFVNFYTIENVNGGG